jgi:thioredoxin reductase (NADPH)
METNWDIIIIGGGPAGLAAGVYCGRALRKTLVLEKQVFGGQIINADIIENYPGYADPIVPGDLMEQMVKQAKRFGVILENDEVTAISPADNLWRVDVYGGQLTARALIYAAGSKHRFLSVPGESELLGRGVSVCATCDAPFFLNRKVAVLGGGDTALVEALHLAKFAAAVFVIHRRDQLRAERILQERVFKNDKIKVLWDKEVLAFKGGHKLEGIELRDKKTSTVEVLDFDGAFLAIGTIPNTELIKNYARHDGGGYIVTDISLRTDSQGLFVAGEVIQGNRRQVAISVGMGVQAALSCEDYLSQSE